MNSTDDSAHTAPPALPEDGAPPLDGFQPTFPPSQIPAPAQIAPQRPPGLAGRLRARAWVYGIWYALGCLAASAFWANSQSGGPGTAIGAFVYLLICTAALTTPGALVARTGLTPRGQRSVLLAVLALAAALTAGTMSTGLLWAAPPFILVLGNAIWSIEEIDRRLEGK